MLIVEPFGEIDTTNKQAVAAGSGKVLVLAPARSLTATEAMIHAAWLVQMAGIQAELTSEQTVEAFMSILEEVAAT